MKTFRLAFILSIIAMLLISSGFLFLMYSKKELEHKQTQLTSARSGAGQYKEYVDRLGSLMAQRTKLKDISRDRDTNVTYEIELNNQNLVPLMQEIAASYSGYRFFLKEATLESTLEGLSVKMKGFKLGKVATP